MHENGNHNIKQVEKEDPNLITVFICFLRSGLRFTRYDTNNVGLAFIEEIKKHNPDFKPVKVQQRERDQIYTVNAYPKEFEQLILSLIEEYRKKHELDYRLKKPRSGGSRGGYNKSSRQGGYSPRPRDDSSGSHGNRYNSSNEGEFRPRRSYDDQPPQPGGYRPRNPDENRWNREDPRPRRDQSFGDKKSAGPDSDQSNIRDNPKENLRPRRPRRESSE